MSDAIDAILKIMDADSEKLKIRTSYNLAAFSFTPEQLVQEIRKLTAIKVIYKPDNRQHIADSWPKSIDDNRAKKDWGWDPKINFSKMVQIMYEHG
jgi:nucleoside-diphosphate-sugar epimerase